MLGYLAAGLAIGPFGLRLVSDPITILHVGGLFAGRDLLFRNTGRPVADGQGSAS